MLQLNKALRNLTFGLIFLVLPFTSEAQDDVPLKIEHTVPDSFYKISRGGDNPLPPVVRLTNTTNNMLSFRLKAKITLNSTGDNILRTRIDSLPFFSIKPHDTIIYRSKEPNLEKDDFYMSQTYLDMLEDNFPDGSLKFCFEADYTQTSLNVANTSNSQLTIDEDQLVSTSPNCKVTHPKPISAPTTVFPKSNDTIYSNYWKIDFNWRHPNYVMPSYLKYRIRVARIKEDQSPSQALANNKRLVDTLVNFTSQFEFLNETADTGVNPSDPNFESEYVWTVQAVDYDQGDPAPFGQNAGTSGLATFHISGKQDPDVRNLRTKDTALIMDQAEKYNVPSRKLDSYLGSRIRKIDITKKPGVISDLEVTPALPGNYLSIPNGCSNCLNSGFEDSQPFLNWLMEAGDYTQVGVKWNSQTPLSQRHKIINDDPFDGNVKKDPLVNEISQVHSDANSAHSLRLGNRFTDAEVERATHCLKVPSSGFLNFNNALIMNDPEFLSPYGGPSYKVEVFKKIDLLPTYSRVYSKRITIDDLKRKSNTSDIYYQDWDCKSIDFSSISGVGAGDKIVIRFSVYDGNGAAYAYIDNLCRNKSITTAKSLQLGSTNDGVCDEKVTALGSIPSGSKFDDYYYSVQPITNQGNPDGEERKKVFKGQSSIQMVNVYDLFTKNGKKFKPEQKYRIKFGVKTDCQIDYSLKAATFKTGDFIDAEIESVSSLTNGNHICVNRSTGVTLTQAKNNSQINFYEWKLEGNLIQQHTKQSPKIPASKFDKTKTVSLEIGNGSGCTTKDEYTVHVDKNWQKNGGALKTTFDYYNEPCKNVLRADVENDKSGAEYEYDWERFLGHAYSKNKKVWNPTPGFNDLYRVVAENACGKSAPSDYKKVFRILDGPVMPIDGYEDYKRFVYPASSSWDDAFWIFDHNDSDDIQKYNATKAKLIIWSEDWDTKVWEKMVKPNGKGFQWAIKHTNWSNFPRRADSKGDALGDFDSDGRKDGRYRWTIKFANCSSNGFVDVIDFNFDPNFLPWNTKSYDGHANFFLIE